MFEKVEPGFFKLEHDISIFETAFNEKGITNFLNGTLIYPCGYYTLLPLYMNMLQSTKARLAASTIVHCSGYVMSMCPPTGTVWGIEIYRIKVVASLPTC